MEVMESIAVKVFKEKPVECPIDHEDLKKIDSKNQFIGVGTTLGENMVNRVSSIIYDPNSQGKPDKQPYPPEAEDGWPIEIDDNDYPVSCAAHHLIPAQASLKKAETLHDWLVYKHEPEPLGGKGGKKTAEGLVWADVGYDVNGSENGVWLPGNYAVGGNGTGEWTKAPSAYAVPDPDGDDDSAPPPPPRKPKPGNRKITGIRHAFDDDNRKSQYVLQATQLMNAQFHDSHGDYSDFVLGVLEKLGNLYSKNKKKWQSDCSKCQERFDKVDDEGIPTHFSLAHRLNSVSRRMKDFLVGKRGHHIVYTSTWGRAAYDSRVARFKKKRGKR